MKESFRSWRPNRSSTERLVKVNETLEKYDAMNITVTLRQLYYSLVGAGTIKDNNVREYKNLGALLSKARMAGLVDWDIIEDRGRQPRILQDFDNLSEAVDRTIRTFRLDRWEPQENHVELWVEKDALSSVLTPITDRLHTPLIVNKGYSSTTAMKDASDRLKGTGKPNYILYLGDLDPSGEDMVRDIEERLYEFGVADLEMKKIALNPAQVRKYKLPHNPVKTTDARHQAFMDKFGDKCYEVDAIPPEDLQKLVTKSIENLMDMKAYDKVISKEDNLKKKLTVFTAGLE